MTPHPLQTKDRNFIYLAQMQTKAILQLQSQVRLLSGVLLNNIIAPMIISPFSKVVESQVDFSNALAEYRSEHIEGQPVVGLGAPYLVYFYDFVVALADNNGAGTVHQSIMQAWASEVDALEEEQKPTLVATMCSHFSIHKIAADSERIRIQVAMSSGELKNSILAGLANITKDISISSGPAPPGFFEEELADWLSVLYI